MLFVNHIYFLASFVTAAALRVEIRALARPLSASRAAVHVRRTQARPWILVHAMQAYTAPMAGTARHARRGRTPPAHRRRARHVLLENIQLRDRRRVRAVLGIQNRTSQDPESTDVTATLGMWVRVECVLRVWPGSTKIRPVARRVSAVPSARPRWPAA